jgi:hypothetical protein
MAIDRRNYEGLIHLIEEMDRLHKNLQESLYCVEDEYNMLKKKEIKHSAQRSTSKRNITIPDEDETLVSKKKLENGNLQRRPISLTKENINSTEEPDEPPFIT